MFISYIFILITCLDPRYIIYKLKEDNNLMVGRVGYAPTTPAMSMQYSTIELTAPL